MSDPHAEFLKQYKQVFHLVGGSGREDVILL